MERPGSLGRPGGIAAGGSSGHRRDARGTGRLLLRGGHVWPPATRPATTRSWFWDGSTYKTLADYINPKKGYILTWLVVFEGAPPPCETAVAVAEPSAIAFLNPADGGVYNAPQPVRFQVNAQPGVKVESTVPDGAIIGDEGPHTLTVTATQGERDAPATQL